MYKRRRYWSIPGVRSKIALLLSNNTEKSERGPGVLEKADPDIFNLLALTVILYRRAVSF